jgi:hypothetical protein
MYGPWQFPAKIVSYKAQTVANDHECHSSLCGFMPALKLPAVGSNITIQLRCATS